MVPNLPYFMVQFDHKGEKGYGHVIEGSGAGGTEDGSLDQTEGSEFPRCDLASWQVTLIHSFMYAWSFHSDTLLGRL